MATAELSKLAGILSTALLQHHLLGFEIAQLEFHHLMDFPGGSDSKVSAYNEEDLDSIPGLGKSPGEGNGNSLQYFCLEDPMDGGAGRLQSMGSQRVRHNFTFFSFFQLEFHHLH